MKTILLLLLSFCMAACSSEKGNKTGENVALTMLQNPVLPGYFADPSVVQYDGKFYVYATADPWGTDFLSCWVSDDFQNWTFHTLNWPTKSACTTTLSNQNKVWAPSVIQKGDAFYMYVSVGSEVWCGKSKHPLGPWENMLEASPLIPYDTTKYYHVIDAEAFIDEDGKTYLYWGSGWDWTNGHCFVAELNDDMCTFRHKPVEVTPAHYFEAPLMKKHNGKYYLTYSEGKTIDETYEVRYAVGDTPFGPFTEAENSPILKVNDSLQVYGPGHHTLFSYAGEEYILYHRHRLPFVKGSAYRQTCIAKITFNEKANEINTIVPSLTQSFPDLRKEQRICIRPESIMSSSCFSAATTADNLSDKNYSTRWEPATDDKQPTLVLSWQAPILVQSMALRFEYPWERYFMKVETSVDNITWEMLADYANKGISGSPVIVPVNKKIRWIRISFVLCPESAKPSVLELCCY